MSGRSRVIHGVYMAGLLLACGFAAAADEVPATIASAQELLIGHQPKQAIPIFRGILEKDRYDLDQAEPALVGLVAAYQLLKGDPQAEADYHRLTAKYLSKEPVLDGVTRLSPDQAREDLLWKGWWDGKADRFVVKSIDRERKISDGVRSSSLKIHVALPSSEKFPVQMMQEANFFDFDRDRGDVTATLPDGTVMEGQVMSFGLSGFHGRGHGESQLQFQVTIEDVQPAVTSLRVLSGRVPVTLIKRKSRNEIPLQVGATWSSAGINGKVTQFHIEDGHYVLGVTTKPKGAGKPNGGIAANGGQMHLAAAGAAAVSIGDDERETGSVWLKGASGKRMFPTSSDSSGSHGNTIMNFHFPMRESAQCIVWESVEETSTHDMTFVLTNVQVP
ncbi:MAG: hypothetical protein AAB263_01250 [Planctomycetota bacterium]